MHYTMHYSIHCGISYHVAMANKLLRMSCGLVGYVTYFESEEPRFKSQPAFPFFFVDNSFTWQCNQEFRHFPCDLPQGLVVSIITTHIIKTELLYLPERSYYSQ